MLIVLGPIQVQIAPILQKIGISMGDTDASGYAVATSKQLYQRMQAGITKELLAEHAEFVAGRVEPWGLASQAIVPLLPSLMPDQLNVTHLIVTTRSVDSLATKPPKLKEQLLKYVTEIEKFLENARGDIQKITIDHAELENEEAIVVKLTKFLNSESPPESPPSAPKTALSKPVNVETTSPPKAAPSKTLPATQKRIRGRDKSTINITTPPPRQKR